MSNGNHFTPGEPLTGVLSLTTSDIDSATTAINLAATRGIFYISATAPTNLDTPDWDRMCWLEPIQWNGEDAYQAWTYSASAATWVKLVAGLPDENGFDDNSIPVRALKATLLEVGMVPVVTNNGGTPLVQWQAFVPTNIPIANLTPGSANAILVTNSGGTGTSWSSFATLLAVLGKVIPLSSLTQSGAYTNQSIKWDGANWVPFTPYTVTTPDLNEATWASASNWLEVWSSALTKTVRKTRKNFFDTLLQDYTAGGISFTTEFMGWTDTVTAPARYTIQALYDLIAPTIISAATAVANTLYPKKYYTTFKVLGPVGLIPTDFLVPIPHGLGGVPSSFGAIMLVTGAATGITPGVGSVLQAPDVWFAMGANVYDRLYVYADATNLYVAQNTNTAAAPLPYAQVVTANIDQLSMQLYAFK